MYYDNQNCNTIIVFSGKICRELLKMGYQIIDVKPDKRNKIKTVFVFKRESGIEDAIINCTPSGGQF